MYVCIRSHYACINDMMMLSSLLLSAWQWISPCSLSWGDGNHFHLQQQWTRNHCWNLGSSSICYMAHTSLLHRRLAAVGCIYTHHLVHSQAREICALIHGSPEDDGPFLLWPQHILKVRRRYLFCQGTRKIKKTTISFVTKSEMWCVNGMMRILSIYIFNVYFGSHITLNDVAIKPLSKPDNTDLGSFPPATKNLCL
mgnify:CR=1 FL=1